MFFRKMRKFIQLERKIDDLERKYIVNLSISDIVFEMKHGTFLSQRNRLRKQIGSPGLLFIRWYTKRFIRNAREVVEDQQREVAIEG